MNWLKSKMEIHRLKCLMREKIWEMMRADYLRDYERELELTDEVDEIRARIAELEGE